MRDSNFHFFFGMLANKLKADITRVLMQNKMSVTQLSALLGVERSRVSHALLAMQRCHVVEAERNGKQNIYYLNNDTVKPLMQIVDRHVAKYCKYCWAKKENETRKRS